MYSFSSLLRTLIFLFFLFSSSFAIAQWQRVDVDAELLSELFFDGGEPIRDAQNRPGYIDNNGIERYPGCSEGPEPLFDSNGQPTGLAPVPVDGGFSFFVDKNAGAGWASNLLIYLAGGGACWDDATCIGSALTPSAVYAPSFLETEESLDYISYFDATGMGGILTSAHPDNPYSGFAKVHIPYCTGDAHIGSRDTDYSFDLFGQPINWTVRHRGFDNLLVVLKWLQRQQSSETVSFNHLTVAGSSAGGYGALMNFPVIKESLGEIPESSLIIDSANGVLTNGFLERAFGSQDAEGVWGVRQNIADILQPILDMDANTLWVSGFDIVGSAYPDTRLSQSTTAFDLVQTLVMLNMQKVDNGTYNPFVPPTEQELLTTGLFDWSPRARIAMLTTAFSVPNYRFYLGAGFGHVHLLDPPSEAFPFPTSNYFEENSARGVEYTNWLDDMLNNPRRFFRTDWRNLSCFPNCLQ